MGVRLSIEGIHPDGTTTTSELELDQPRIAVGRAASSDVLLPHASVSTLHATIRVSGTGYALVDEGSTNGTFVDDQRLVPERPRTLKNGDTIRIGPFRLRIALGVATHGGVTDATQAGKRLLPREPRSLAIRTGSLAGATIELPDAAPALVIGRAEDAFLRLDDAECSRCHALLDVADDEVVVRDAESKNGIAVNGKPTSKRALRDGDEVLVGATSIVFVDPRDARLRALARAEGDAPYETIPSQPSESAPRVEATGESRGVDLFEEVAGEETVPVPKARPPAKRPVSRDAMADRFAFGLAVVVLALSIAAFLWLFGDAR